MAELLTAITPRLYRIEMPVPLPLRSVNCYLLQHDSHWTVIDTGMRYAKGEAVWQQVWAELGMVPQQISDIYVTHYHPDHYGMAGWLQALSGATVWMSPIEAATVQRVWEASQEHVAQVNLAFWAQHGMPEEAQQAIMAMMLDTIGFVEPRPVVSVLDPITPLLLAGELWQPLILPGHSDGQLALYQAQSEILLIADHVLPRITPNISLWPESRQDPLTAYLASFADLPMHARTILPGHGQPFEHLLHRCNEIAAHHVERLDAMQQAAGAGANAWQISQKIFPIQQLTSHQVRFAIAETLAHMAYLVQHNRVRETFNGEHILFNI